MERTCVRKGSVFGMNFIFGIFGIKTMGICVQNKTADKQRSFRSFIAWNIAHKLMTYNLLAVLVAL